MLNALPAIAAFLLMRRFQVSPGENAGLTAVAAITPGALGLAPAIVAAGVARQGGGSPLGGRRMRPMRRRYTVPSPPAPDNAPSVVTVPNVVGLSFGDAQRTFGANLVAGRYEVHSADTPENVIDQNIPAGRRVDPGTMVGLTVSLGPAAAAPPDEVAEMKAITDLRSDVDGQFKTLTDAITNLTAKVQALPQSPPPPAAPPAPAPEAAGGSAVTTKK